MMAVYGPSFMRGEPSKEDALFLGAWTCAMGASGCDMTYCAYSRWVARDLGLPAELARGRNRRNRCPQTGPEAVVALDW